MKLTSKILTALLAFSCIAQSTQAIPPTALNTAQTKICIATAGALLMGAGTGSVYYGNKVLDGCVKLKHHYEELAKASPTAGVVLMPVLLPIIITGLTASGVLFGGGLCMMAGGTYTLASIFEANPDVTLTPK